MWLGWVGANAAGIVVALINAGLALLFVSMLAGFALVATGGRPGQSPSLGPSLVHTAIAVGVVYAIIGAAAAGLSIGGLQSLVLSRRGVATTSWMLWTAVGFVLGAALTVGAGWLMLSAAPVVESVPRLGRFYPYLTGAALGAVIGGAQWLRLRTHVDRAWRWVAAHAVALAAIQGLSVALLPDVSNLGRGLPGAAPADPSQILAAFSMLGYLLLVIVLGWVVLAAVTGIVLTRLQWHLPSAAQPRPEAL
jgi:hypothetical protein